jgi:predicted ATPase
MRIREIAFKDFRCFRGERRISFVDPVTDTVRPVTVLAGSNGSGKTTLLDAIEALLTLLVDQHNPTDLVNEVLWWGGGICLTVEFSLNDLPKSVWSYNSLKRDESEIVTIKVGEIEMPYDPRTEEDFAPFIFAGELDGKQGLVLIRSQPLGAQVLLQTISQMIQSKTGLHNGLLYLPHDRRLAVTRGGPIEPPLEKREWLFRFSPSDEWQGSLEHLWVWQNYLDLEQSTKDRQNLIPFVETVETVLGNDRRIRVYQGQVLVPVSWGQGIERPDASLDQLPSGEQQVLLLFGELARRRRRGAVIMIDEIENSLHPTLQRLVMWNLRRIAREWDAQVIVATHSLEVINTVRGGAFINLDYPEDRFDLPVPEQEEKEAP